LLLLPPTDLGFLLLPAAQSQALAAAGSQQPLGLGGREAAGESAASGGFKFSSVPPRGGKSFLLSWYHSVESSEPRQTPSPEATKLSEDNKIQ